ncbi:hypothetical protein VNO77_00317 [Canavalia gladiata]|uniref:Uncharacterized protein n=1 Tax=Canavalia gladiata TaxID=3824 RepID=A0AAN9MP73_CANGL
MSYPTWAHGGAILADLLSRTQPNSNNVQGSNPLLLWTPLPETHGFCSMWALDWSTFVVPKKGLVYLEVEQNKTQMAKHYIFHLKPRGTDLKKLYFVSIFGVSFHFHFSSLS